ncbi:sigma-E factor negative regulatory protein [Aquipseudomonas ullengensis]|uniref:RNA polymerase subunit sigma n=1 Tax=Aquipseudomonas ullengensis TaxID=2759166 RepID=A0A7W4LKI9_9GAMM|nr:RseA family anti-sigma factor [Pseudomonas ullengensis]MBB2494816.1 RNA polymerase subunit sigma [Pseudomonas ullengensis]
MSREALQESLSAVMDNEADELELRRVLAASDDNELRATWSRYQIARAVMHKELLEPRLDIAAAVSAALAEEAVPAKPASGVWRTIGRVAVAASVTVAVLAGVRFYNQDEIGGTQLAQQGAQPGLTLPQMQTQGPAVLAGYNPDEGVVPQQPSVQVPSANWQEQRLPSYLRQHAQQAAASSADSALPYARAASLENR